ncbi:serine hydrolase domain-containing protein [Chryseolinea lacunae]|uniref:Beta-lactamase family protein n=1 Tax=Chryseolinea lacunae TaxID=2801331 RepID=A0ABS1L0D3_9BACT|nr:serine hydrolase domain-containing protein [Chryseolinea lacunae]MBL0745170.1 beta-lactamase family protein [Chryseolinea lacunae]
MKLKRYIFIGVLLIAIPFLVAQVVREKPDAPAPFPKAMVKPRPFNPIVARLLKTYEKELALLAEASHTPGAAIAVVQDSTIVYLKGIGKRSADGPAVVDVHTVFRIASVSKCFASFLTGILVQDSVLHWDERVVDRLPRFALQSAEETQKLTLRHVLSHATGLPYHTYTNMVEEGASLDSMLAWLKKIPLATPVGMSYSYQNVAYSLIGKVIESATGKTYEDEMRERVFGPLQMRTASIDYASIRQNPNVAQPHKMRGGKWVPASITSTYYNVAPAGGVNASISDMAQWMIALLGNRPNVISPATLQQLFTPEVKARSKNRNYGRMHRLSDSFYGLGWRVIYYPDDTLIYHGGFVNGYRSEVAVNPKERFAVCILANAPGDLADNGIPLFFNLLQPKRDSINAWEEQQRKLRQVLVP